MNIYDAAKVLCLSGEVNKSDVKHSYIAACKKYHPDINPAGESMMKAVNEAFEALKEFEGTLKEEGSNYGEELNDALNAIFGLDLDIEVCGSWVWVTGDTRNHKDALKGAGFKWAPKKKAWYYRPAGFRSFGRGKASLDEIRVKYGSTKPNFNRQYLAA